MPIRSVPNSWEGADAPKLIPVGQPGKSIVLSRPITFIGQRRDAHVRLAVPGVSSLHAIISIDSSGAWIHDLASRTGTNVNGHQVAEARLRSQDTVKIGAASFEFIDPRPSLTPEIPGVRFSIETNDGQSLSSSSRFFSIGRRPGSNWRLEMPDVSLTHAAICQLDGRLFLRDAGSRRGTHLNGLRVSLVQILPTDLFSIADVKFRVKWSAEERAENAIRIHDASPDAIPVPHPSTVGRVTPPSEELSTELLDSLFGDDEVSASQSAADQAMNDTGSVDWGFLKSAIPTIAADSPPADKKPNPN